MENNIFKGAKFGDKFLCKNGRIALYISPADSYENESIRAYSLTIQYQGDFDVLEDGRLVNSDGTYGNDEFDIISRYQEEIDEDILRDALYNFISENFYVTTSEGDYDYGEQSIGYCSDRTHEDSKNVNLYAISDDFIDYYRKAKEE